MADYRTVGVQELNKWLWSKIKTFEYKPGVKAFAAFTGSGNSAGYDVVPIFPLPQQAQVLDMTFGREPLLFYNFAMSAYSSEWWLCKEQCAFILYDDNEERLRALLAFIATLTRRMDVTAQDINKTVSPNFDFKYVQLTSVTGPDDYNTEGGTRRGAMIVVSYEYTVNQDDDGMRI